MAVKQYDGGMFHYEPLLEGQSAIRLVRLKPALSPEGMLQCEMFHGSTDANYRCLSYRWGEGSASFPILINEAQFCIRKQLHEFLMLQRGRLASKTGSKEPSREPNEPLWIDALCIDQTNNPERGHQVAQMGQIFSKADEVLIWLGSTPMLTSLCATYKTRLKRFVSSMTLEDKAACFHLHNDSNEMSPLLTYTWLAGQEDPALRVDISKREVLEEEFIHNKYWSRAWITQEVCLARRAVLVLEVEENLPLEKFLDVVQQSFWPVAGTAFWQLSTSLSDLKDKSFNGMSFLSESFISLFYRFRDKDCAIPRDRIFSILPLYRRAHLVNVNYDSTDDQLLVQLFKDLKVFAPVCFVASLVHSLRPLTGSLGSGYLEMKLRLTTLHWGPLHIFRTHLSTSSKSCNGAPSAPPIYARTLDRMADESASSRGEVTTYKPSSWPASRECKVWLSMRQYCLKQITLVGLPTGCSWADADIPGAQICLPNADLRHMANDHPKALPGSHSSKDWRLYTEGVTLEGRHEEPNIWTFRVSLATVWAYMEETGWKQPEPCIGMCRDVCLGYNA